MMFTSYYSKNSGNWNATYQLNGTGHSTKTLIALFIPELSNQIKVKRFTNALIDYQSRALAKVSQDTSQTQFLPNPTPHSG